MPVVSAQGQPQTITQSGSPQQRPSAQRKHGAVFVLVPSPHTTTPPMGRRRRRVRVGAIDRSQKTKSGAGRSSKEKNKAQRGSPQTREAAIGRQGVVVVFERATRGVCVCWWCREETVGSNGYLR